jgi:hypothetical protein
MSNQTGLNIPAELDTMAALSSLVMASSQPVKENLPATTQLIPDKDYSAPQRTDGATVTDNDPLFSSPVPPAKDSAGPSLPAPASIQNISSVLAPAGASAPAFAGAHSPASDFAAAPVAASVNGQRFFFTGRTGVGKDWLAGQIKAKVLDSSAPLVAAAREIFPQATKAEHFAGLFPTIYAWGEGTIDKNYPLTPARWLFVQAMQGKWGGFGTPGFWVRLLVESSAAIEGRVAITNVSTPGAFKALKDAGFTHFHVMTSPAAYMQRNKRPGSDDRLANALDQDAIKKVSAQRQGEKLPVVWNATEAPPSARLWTVQEFLQSLDAAPQETFSAFE